MLFGTRRQPRECDARTVPSRAREAGAYLTDGARLYRVIAPLRPTVKPAVAVLEDCLTLRARVYTAEELWHMGLSPVRRG